MKARLLFACAAAGIAFTAFGATTAVAQGHTGTFDIAPGEVRPGDTVTLTATCDYPDFTAPAGIESGTLVPTEMTGEKDTAGVWHLTGTTTVDLNAKPGPASALFTCGPGGDVTVGKFTVLPPENAYAAIGIQDAEIRPGQEVRVVASCRDPRFEGSKIVSPVVTAPDFVREDNQPVTSPFFSVGKVDADAKPGTYPISFTCVDREVSGEFTVLAAGAKPSEAQVPVKPKGSVDTGSLDQPVTAGGSGPLLAGAGAAALLAAGGAAVWAHRRRQRA